MADNVLLFGKGGREHALAWIIFESPKFGKLFAFPGNAGIAELAELVSFTSFDNLLRLIDRKAIALVVIGPESYLAQDLAGKLRERGIPVFGPSAASARIETSKAFAKELMRQAGIPTAPFICHPAGTPFSADESMRTWPKYVVKADGPASGKGVEICNTPEEVNQAVANMHARFGDSARKFVIERFLEGKKEVSCHLLCDGTGLYLPFPVSCDYKTLNGKNTGGMGAVAPTTRLISKELTGMVFKIFNPVFDALKQETGEWFVGCLYPGLIITRTGIRVLEFNARFGDPETQPYMRLIDSDFLELLLACAHGKLKEINTPRWRKGYAVSVGIATEGYPDRAPRRPERIYGIRDAERISGVKIFHGNTEMRDGHVYALEGRAIHVSAVGDSLEEAISQAYEAVGQIRFAGMQYRADIGYDLIGKI